jgi:hypothetical protein
VSTLSLFPSGDYLLTPLPDEYFDDLGAAYRAEIKELYDLGCRKSKPNQMETAL